MRHETDILYTFVREGTETHKRIILLSWWRFKSTTDSEEIFCKNIIEKSETPGF